MGKKCFALFTIVLSLLIAANAGAFTLTPTRIEKDLRGGETLTQSFTVGNPSEEEIRIKVTLSDFSFAPGGDITTAKAGKLATSATSWITFTPREFTLSPKREMLVRYTISPPKNTQGEYYAMFFFSQFPSPTARGLSIIARMGIPIYLFVGKEGKKIIKGKVTKFLIRPFKKDKGLAPSDSSRAKSREAKGKIEAVVTFYNTGNAHVRPAAKISIKNDRGAQLRLLKFPENLPVVPNKFRHFFAYGNKLRAGYYTATLMLDYGDPEEIIEETIKFRVLENGKIFLVKE